MNSAFLPYFFKGEQIFETSFLLPCIDKPFQNDGILDRCIGIWCKFGEYLYIDMAFFLCSVWELELVRDNRNTSDKLNFFLLSAMFYSHLTT